MNLRQVVCLQLTPTQIRASSFRGDSKVVSAETAFELPAGTDLFQAPTLAEHVRGALETLAVRPKQALLSIPGNGVILKRFQLPAFENANKANIERVLALEIPNHISVPLEQAVYDKTISHQTDTAIWVLLAWMRKAPLVSLISALEKISLSPVCVVPSPVVLANHLLSREDCSGKVCGIQLGRGQFDVVMIESGQFLGGRSLPVAQTENPAAIWRSLTQSLSAIPGWSGGALQRVFVYQDEAIFSADSVKAQLGVDHCEIRALGDDWALALRQTVARGGGLRLNLLTPILNQRAAARKQRQKQRLIKIAPFAAVLGLIGANFGLWQAAESTQARIETRQGELANVQAKEKQVRGLREAHTALEKQIAELRWVERDFPPLQERLKRLAEATPETVRLTEIKTVELPRATKERQTFDARETLLVTGLARSQGEIDAFRVKLATGGDFSSVRQIQSEQLTIKDEPWLTFVLALK